MNTVTCTDCKTLHHENTSWDNQTRRLAGHACPSCGSLGAPLESEISGVIREALDRHRRGQEKYGVFNPATDRRDLFSEIEEELLDAINYLTFQILKLREAREKGDPGDQAWNRFRRTWVTHNRRQSQFVAEYLIDLNASRAAARSGYKHPDRQGPRLLTLTHVQAAVEEALEARMKRLQMTAANVLIGLALIARANMQDYMTVGADGSPRLDWANLTRDQASALIEVTVDEYTDGRGEEARSVRRVRFKLADKLRALELLGKHLGLFAERVEHSGGVNLEAVKIVHAD